MFNVHIIGESRNRKLDFGLREKARQTIDFSIDKP